MLRTCARGLGYNSPVVRCRITRMDDFYEKLAPHVDKIVIPGGSDKIHKDECVFSFDTPESEGGLYVCLNTFLGFAKRHVERHYAKTGNAVYLHLKTVNVQEQREVSDQGKKKYEDHRSLVILPDFDAIPLPDRALPQAVQLSIAAVLSADSATVIAEREALERTSQEAYAVSWYSEWLEQLDNGVQVPSKGWKCEQCGAVENLWMNLTDGSILCAQKTNCDSDHLTDHYHRTGYPLAVRLGTITPNSADVYSFIEEQMVIDTNLAKHLKHFGIDMANMQKTEKTALELHNEASNENEAAMIQAEFGQGLERPFGPGYTGLTNLGNSCYMNAIIQVIMSIPDFKKKYYDAADQVFDNAPSDPAENFTVQMTKVAVGIISGEYSRRPPTEGDNCSDKLKVRCSIKPLMFKALIAKNNPEYLPMQQQDALEFLLCLLDLVEKNCKGSTDPTDCFKFEVEECIQCTESGKVCYTNHTDLLLSLPVPLESALNAEDVKRDHVMRRHLVKMGVKIKEAPAVKYKLPLSACLDAFASTEQIKDFYSTAVNRKVDARKTTKLRTFPDYLMVQLKKFFLDDNWKPHKLDVEMLVPDELDLNFLRGNGLQPGEELLPEPEENGGPTEDPEVKTVDVSKGETEPPAGPQIRDGPGNYQLVAFVSHMGRSARHGHYMCHILKEGTWVMFSNEQVAISPQPPKEFGYLYLYRRIPDDSSEEEPSPKRAKIYDSLESVPLPSSVGQS